MVLLCIDLPYIFGFAYSVQLRDGHQNITPLTPEKHYSFKKSNSTLWPLFKFSPVTKSQSPCLTILIILSQCHSVKAQHHELFKLSSATMSQCHSAKVLKSKTSQVLLCHNVTVSLCQSAKVSDFPNCPLPQSQSV